MLGPSPETHGKKKSSAESAEASGEINDLAAEAELRKELGETEIDLERISFQIRKLEAAAKAPPTDDERQRMQKKMDDARAAAEATGKNADEAEQFVQATKKTFLESREGIRESLTRLRQRATDLAEQKQLLEKKLGGTDLAA